MTFRGRKGSYSHCMFLDDHPPIAGGRELWGFPKKLAKPTLHAEIDTLVGTLDYGPVRVALGTMGYKHQALEHGPVLDSLLGPNWLLKIIPHVDGTARICELVEYGLKDVFCGVPVVLGRGGMQKIVQLALNDSEKAMLAKSADDVRKGQAEVAPFLT